MMSPEQRFLAEQLRDDGYAVELEEPAGHDGTAVLRVTATHGSLPGEELRQIVVLVDAEGEVLEVRTRQGGHPPERRPADAPEARDMLCAVV